MITRTFSQTGTRTQVSFKLKIADNISGASVVGDFNNWTPGAHKLKADKSGYLTTTVSLPTNQNFAFKYLTTGGMWLNDNAADDYHTNEWGESNSIVDTTLPANFNTTKKTPKKKATAKKKTTAKKATSKKAAAKNTADKKVAKKKAAAKKAKKERKPKSEKAKKKDK